MKTKILCLTIMVLLYGLPQTYGEPLTVTYIANEGFMLESGDQKVLVDALFGKEDLSFCEVPSADLLKQMVNAEPPFDDVDVVLVTHDHRDHFDPDLLMQYLQHNQGCLFVGPDAAVKRLAEQDGYDAVKERVRAATPNVGQSESVSAEGIEIQALRLQHASRYEPAAVGTPINQLSGVVHVGFLIRMGSWTVLHTGDSALEEPAEYRAYRLTEHKIDVAFLGSLFWKPLHSRIDLVQNEIRPDRIVLMHYRKNERDDARRMEKRYRKKLPPVLIFEHQMDRQAIPPID